MATNAGAVEVSTATDEFTAAMLGWPVRTFESTVPPGKLGWGWAKFAFGSWTTLSLGRRQRLAPRRAEGLVLQRHDHRGQAVVDFDLKLVAYLSSEAGAQALRDVDGYRLTDASRVSDIASIRKQFGDRAPALVETVLLRRKATAKFDDPSNWLFTGDALQQATAATRWPNTGRGGSRARLCTTSPARSAPSLRHCGTRPRYVVGSDIDPVRLAMARHNVGGVALCRADALRPVTRDTVVVADPADAGRPGDDGSTRATTPRRWTVCSTSIAAAISS